ncbi:MAG: hypothetical protein QGH15_14240 [Kiritimatiellia bacterium]|jgi:hypothetical protein|nr:hypothetical protein [Kiritimatiellia bacterium]
MDKVLSARVDESVVSKIGALARELHTTKKSVIEAAIKMFAAKIEEEQGVDLLDLTFGAWKRKETPQATVRRARRAFSGSMTRHHR